MIHITFFWVNIVFGAGKVKNDNLELKQKGSREYDSFCYLKLSILYIITNGSKSYKYQVKATLLFFKKKLTKTPE